MIFTGCKSGYLQINMNEISGCLSVVIEFVKSVFIAQTGYLSQNIPLKDKKHML